MKTLHWRPLKDNELHFQSFLVNLLLIPVMPFFAYPVALWDATVSIWEELRLLARSFIYDKSALEAQAALEGLRHASK